MSTVTDPRLDATKTYGFLTKHLLCTRSCPCGKAANRSSGQVHCPGCTGAVPTLEIAVRGGSLTLHCSGGCPDENVWVAVADLLADGDPVEVYRYVDTAVGGTDHRNRVREVEGFAPIGRTDVYTTYQRATIGLDYYVQLHRNKEGNPSVEKYPGRLWTPLFPIDIDNEDLRVSLDIAREIVRRLDGLGVPLKAVRCYFSGSKGFSIELPATLFGGFEPSADLPRRLKRVAALLMPEIDYDGSIYSLLRLWRVPNSRHSKTRLYKIQLTANELLSLDIEQIQILAASPLRVEDHPELTPIPDDEWHAVEALVDIWARAEQTVDDDGATRERRRGTVTDEARDRQTVAAVAASWPAEKKADLPEEKRRKAGQVSRHHDYLMPIIGFLARRTSDEHLAELLIEAAEQSGDRDFLAGRDYRSEIERLVASSSEKVRKGEKAVGLPTLAEKFPVLADVLRALWPDPEIRFTEDGAQGAPTASPSGRQRGPGASGPDDVSPFPLETLPPVLRALAEAGARSIVAPVDFVAVPLLVAAGAAIGDALELELKPGWREGANLYAANVGDPGSKKTPMQALAMRPVHRIQGRLAREYKDELRAYEAELAAWDADKKNPDRGRAPEPPIFRHVVTTDATTEALAPMLKQSKGLVLFKDELTGWVRSMDQYRGGGRGADRQHFLSMWSRTLIKVDRKASREPIIVPRPCLSVVGGIQPDLLPDLADAAQREDGFLDRLLWSFPAKITDRWTRDGIALATVQAVEAVFDRLYRLEGDLDEDGEPVSRVIPLSEQAAEIWADWYAEHVAEMEDETFPRQIRGPWAKMPSQLARLSLILHALWSCPVADEVAGETLGAAADLVDYFKSHARRAYGHLARERRDLVTLVLAALKQHGPLKQSQFVHDVFKRNIPAERIRATLEGLEAAGLVIRDVVHDAGRPPSTVWRLA